MPLKAALLRSIQQGSLCIFKGMGDVDVDIFFHEVQVVWEEVFSFADRRALEGAQRLGLMQDFEELLRFVSRRDFPKLVAALVRVRLKGDNINLVPGCTIREEAS